MSNDIEKIRQLSREDWRPILDRSYYFAIRVRKKYGALPLSDPQDVVHDAVRKILDGTRKCNLIRDGLLVTIMGIIKSTYSHEAQSKIEVPTEFDDQLEEDVFTLRPSFKEMNSDVAELREIYNFLKNEKIEMVDFFVSYCDCVFSGCKTYKEIAQKMGMNQARFYRNRERLSALLKEWREKMCDGKLSGDEK